MNSLYKLYCRTFQTVFKLAIPILPYRKPEVLDSVRKIPEVLKQKEIDSVLVVTDGFLHESGMLDDMKNSLEDAGVSYVVYDKTVANPMVSNVEEARELYLKSGCKGLIGFGGGSSIDCAKAVGARIARPNKLIPQMKGILQIVKKIPFLIAVPTTAGTGSETTVTTVITDEKTHFKFPISDFPLIPRVAVLDPELTRTLPPHMISTTGMDALTHAIEAYIGRSTTRETRADALKAAELIAENLEICYRERENTKARANMLKAAYLAGSAFSKSYVGYCHAVAHSLGGQYKIPHGLANAVLLPYTLEMYGSVVDKKLKDIAVAMHLADAETPAGDAAYRLIMEIRNMNERMGIPETLPGIKKADIPQLAEYAAKEANPLYPVPVLMGKRELERFYYRVGFSRS